ncbi:ACCUMULATION AND REPLICATION OF CHLOROPLASTS chloroplastic [Micractinium conductrix]|uniref:ACCUMULATION AND REPLICATION OF CHLOROPLASTS chloroplastic n=1 Tax=Micractinium conductrix TaxID=554055 RepID=A0A2P6UZ89_9CHLO|nr:ACCUMULATION AND REPLICATION OF CHLOROPLASTS chloroplastic [Micractinium conductrix]|eukprot:PSC67149.1 ACCUMULATION AND REPLICATION OF CHLOROPLASTS chloroplastic [Micractinium conductrix]
MTEPDGAGEDVASHVGQPVPLPPPQKAQAPAAQGHTVAQRPLVVVLLLATGTQLLLAMYGLLSRYVQIEPVQPVPALSLVVITNLIGEATMLALHLLPTLLLRLWRSRKLHSHKPALPLHAPGRAGSDGSSADTPPAEPHEGAGGSEGSADELESGIATPDEPLQSGSSEPAGAARPRPAAAASTLRPPVAMLRGLSRKMERWEAGGRPQLRRRLALCCITAGFMGTCSLQILAPGFVDVSIVQLTTQWTTLLIALTQAALLRQRLPRAFWVACPAMLAGACMVIVPAVGQNVAGSLNTARGWWGFGMAVGALMSTVFYYTMLQATRHMGFSAVHLQHYMNCASVLFFTCLSLPLDGAAWGCQFAGWVAKDWLALVCVWKLGAPTAAMFFGLRLVFAVVLSTPILGSTVIQTGLQIAGVVITALAVTGYAFSQWWVAVRLRKIKPMPPMPALRLVVVANLIAEAAMVAFHLLPVLLLRLWCWHKLRSQALPLPLHAPGGDKPGSSAGKPPAKQLGSGSSEGSCGELACGAASEPAGAIKPRPAAAASTLRPPVAMLRGLSRKMERWEAGGRPQLRRRLALCCITAGFVSTCSLHFLAPGFVDVSIVQLCALFIPLGIALVQAALLRVPLPRAFYFACPTMLAGACMIIIPSVKQTVAGSLNTARGWLGFGMAVGQMLSTVFYYTMLQATRHMGFSAVHLQHYMNCASVLFFTCLSLPLDGAAWGCQFAGWVAKDWLALVCVWKLGAPTAAMFFGLRLVFAVVLSTPILGSTVIQTGLQPKGHTLAQQPLVVLLFLLLATCTQMCLAMYGVLSRWLQIKPMPPMPALRLVVVANLIAEAAMVAFHLLPVLLLRLWCWHKLRSQALPLPLHAPGGDKPGSSAGKPPAKQLGSGSSEGSCGELACGAASEPAGAIKPRPAAAASTLRPPVAMLRGLSRKMERWEAGGRPQLRRRLALCCITAGFVSTCSLHFLAPGFVDVSIVQLCALFIPLGIALVQAALLRVPLPRAFYFACPTMLAGACMIIIPSVKQTVAGSLNTARGWLGFGMAVGQMLSTVFYYTMLQATRHMGFSAVHLQHYMNCASVLFFTCLSLPLDGAAWGCQFAGWVAKDWLALVCVWKLGAPTAAMFFGLRLVFAVVLSTPILGSTVIQTGLQPKGHTLAQQPLVVLLFLLLATCTQMCLAMYGVLSRWLQIKPMPPMPALRLVVVANLIAEAAMVAFHLLPVLLLRLWCWHKLRSQALPLPLHAPGGDKPGSSAGKPPAKQLGSGSSEGSCGELACGAASEPAGAIKPRPAAAASTLRPPVAMLRGLSRKMERWEAGGRPQLRRRLALCCITAGFVSTCSLHFLAPGFVDVSIVQLCALFIPLGIALVQAALLRVPLPRAFYFACPTMLAGACMIIIPSVKQTVAGSLNTARGWLGFGMAVGQMLSTVFYYTMLQATRHMGFSAVHLQHYMNCASVLFFTCLSLPLDGAAWGCQFAGWVAKDWLALVCVWKLGAPTAAMFFGLRLVFAVVLSTPILGSTVIQTGLQPKGHTLAQQPLVVLLFLLLATCTQMCLAMYGVLSRWLQIKPMPPMPALRLVVVANLIAEAAMVAFHLLPVLLLRLWCWHKLRSQALPLPLHAPGGDKPGSSAGKPPAKQLGSGSSEGSCGELACGAASEPAGAIKPRPAAAASTLRPPVAMLRGLSRKMERWEAGGRPQLRRRLALCCITAGFVSTCSLHFLAPGFVDVSIVQLCALFIPLGIALVQAALLRVPLPRAFYFACPTMLAGACMIIIPSVKQTVAGSLNTARGWLGFGMAVGQMLSTVFYYTMLQATRHMGFSAVHLQHYMNCASVLFFTCLSLPLDGAAWGCQFAGWVAKDWLALVCVWKLGAPTAAMFFGLRLVFAVVLSTPILGSTVIQTGLQLLGLEDATLLLGPQIEAAYDDLLNTPLEEGYSELARLGKEKLLFAARERLRAVRGRTALLSASVAVEPLLLAGAMALLHQVRQYDTVIALSEEGAALGTRDIRSSSRDTLKHFEQDMALATALAQCGLADRALKSGQAALAWARLGEALDLLTDASGPAAAGGRSAVLPGRGTGGEASTNGRAALAPRLQADIRAALAEHHPEAVADYLQHVTLDRADFDLRAREVAALRRWVAAPGTAGRRPDGQPVCTAEYMERVLPHLTAGELCSLYDWEWLAAGADPARCPWYFPGLLKRAALAHLVAGFAERRPLLVRTAQKLFGTVKKTGDDVSLALAMCHLLLGNAAAALKLLEEDEVKQQQAVAAARRHKKGRGGSGGAAEAAGMGAAPRPDLGAYFEEPRVQAFLAAQDGRPSGSGGMLSLLSSARSALAARFAGGPSAAESTASSAASELPPQLRRQGFLPLPLSAARTLQALAGAAALAVGVWLGVGMRAQGSGGAAAWPGGLWPGQPGVPPEAAQAAADIGLPPGALRMEQQLSERWAQQQREQQQAAAEQQRRQQEEAAQQQAAASAAAAARQQDAGPVAAAPQQQQQRKAVEALSQSAAEKLVKQWLRAKADAMGPRHKTEQLPQVLAEPMLSAVAQEAAEAAQGGWYWRLKPLKAKVERVDGSSYNAASGGGHVTVLARVSESAELWAAGGGQEGDSYDTTYEVEYALVRDRVGWRIASALVLRK